MPYRPYFQPHNVKRAVSAIAFALFCAPGSAHGIQSASSEDAAMTLGIGAFDVTDTDSLAAEGFVDYRFGHRRFGDYFGESFRGVGPMLGFKANSDGGLMGHGSLFIDIRPAANWVVWPSAGVGGYRPGNSRDLGGVFQFHLGAHVGYRWDERTMLGISFQHVSNGGFQPINPGADSVFITYSILFD